MDWLVEAAGEEVARDESGDFTLLSLFLSTGALCPRWNNNNLCVSVFT